MREIATSFFLVTVLFLGWGIPVVLVFKASDSEIVRGVAVVAYSFVLIALTASPVTNGVMEKIAGKDETSGSVLDDVLPDGCLGYLAFAGSIIFWTFVTMGLCGVG